MTAQQVVLASGNAGKLKEFSALLSAAGIRMISQHELGVGDIAEPYGTFVENALAKARYASQQTGLPALADDSGLCIEALAGAPGVYSARYASQHGREKSDAANNQLVLEQLQNNANRRAWFISVLVYMRSATDPMPIICEGIWPGEIAQQAHGAGGFGYDPIFYVPGLGKTAAELSAEEKNQESHRARALAQLLQRLT